MFRAGSGETRAGLFYLRESSQKFLPWLKGTFRMLVLAVLFVNAFVNFDFELLPLATAQRRLDGQPAEGWSWPA
jgi:hypothetical protein